MTTVAPSLPEGWLWHLDGETQRWQFFHVETEHKQPHFPKAGDENLAKAQDVPPAYSSVPPTLGGAVSVTSVVAVDEASTVDGVAHLTGTVASVSVEPTTLGLHRNAFKTLRRKPVGQKEPLDGAAAPVAAQVPTTGPGLSAENSDFQQVSLGPPVEECAQFNRPSTVPETSATNVASIAQTVPAVRNADVGAQAHRPTATNSRPGHVADQGDVQGFAPLQPIQTAPLVADYPQLQRPELSTVQSAPQILQADSTHILDQHLTEPKKSRLSRMSRNVGDWAKKHPTLAVGSAVMVEVAGLAGGIDVSRNVQAVQRMTQSVKRNLSTRPAGAQPTERGFAGRPGQMSAAGVVRQQNQAQLQQNIQQYIQQSAQQQSQQMMQQLLQQQMSGGQMAPNQQLPGFATPMSPMHNSPLHRPYGLPNQGQTAQGGQGLPQYQNPSMTQQINPQQQSSASQTGFPNQLGNTISSPYQNQQAPNQAPQQLMPNQQQPQAPIQPQQQSGTLGDMASNLTNAYQNNQAAQQQAALQQQMATQPQQSPSGLADIASNALNAYQNTQANQAAQQQAAIQQQASMQQPQTSSIGLGDMANNLFTTYQNNQASQQQMAMMQQQNAAQQQAYQAQLAQYGQMNQNPAMAQQPVYIDNSGGGSGSLADALAMATLMDPTLGLGGNDQAAYITSDSLTYADSAGLTATSSMAFGGNEQAAYITSSDPVAWTIADDSAATELI